MTPNDLDMFDVKNTNLQVTHTPKAHIFVRFVLRWDFLSYGSIFGKVHRMTPNDLNILKIINSNMHPTYTPEAQIFVRFTLRWAVFELTPKFGKSATNAPKWPWHVEGQKYQHACHLHTRAPNFRLLHCTMSRFWVMQIFWFGNVHFLTTNELNTLKVENTNMGVTYTPGAHIFVRFALRSVLELARNFWKSAPNDTKWPWHIQGQKHQHACYIHPRGPNFHVSLLMSRFWVKPNFWKSALNDPKVTLTCSRSKIPSCMVRTPTGHKFSSVSLYGEPFWRQLRFLHSQFFPM